MKQDVRDEEGLESRADDQAKQEQEPTGTRHQPLCSDAGSASQRTTCTSLTDAAHSRLAQRRFKFRTSQMQQTEHGCCMRQATGQVEELAAGTEKASDVKGLESRAQQKAGMRAQDAAQVWTCLTSNL